MKVQKPRRVHWLWDIGLKIFLGGFPFPPTSPPYSAIMFLVCKESYLPLTCWLLLEKCFYKHNIINYIEHLLH